MLPVICQIHNRVYPKRSFLQKGRPFKNMKTVATTKGGSFVSNILITYVIYEIGICLDICYYILNRLFN